MQSDEFDLIKLYANVFKGLEGLGDTAPRCLFSPFTKAASFGKQAKAEKDKMLEMNVIELVEEPTDWCSDLIIA